MNEEEIVEEIKKIKGKLQRIHNITKTTNILLALILILFLLIAAYNGFRWM